MGCYEGMRFGFGGARLISLQVSFFFTALEATQGQMHGFLSQLPYKCHLKEVEFVGD